MRLPHLLRHARRSVIASGVSAAVVLLAGVGAYATLDNGGASSDSGMSQDSHAIVVNHGDNRYRYAITLKVVQVGGDVVDPQNAAVAVAANCTNCQTVAISMEGVLVYGDPSVFTPTNLALAYNENCSNCATLAAAFQEIVPNDGRVRISGEGRQIIADVRVDLESLRRENLSLDEIDARVDADAARLLDVLRNDVFPVGQPAGAGSPSDASTGLAPAVAGTSSTPDSGSPTAAPTSATPSVTDSPAPTATPTG